ncbi:flavin-containing monooxygenase [Hyphomonas sp. NPDC076900]|uniref:flavin-containing monooxygenase n=1 Tax=unclassified Hyphomonas TaxID=2630699 RepID=UPI003D062862
MGGKRICVIGAGPSGLVATKTLAQAGLDAQCFDLSPVVGGQWVIDNPNGRSAAYRSLKTNTPRRMNRFSDFPMPEDWPVFPSAAQVAEWLTSYAEAFNLASRLHLNTEVLKATPLTDQGWIVQVRGPDGTIRDEAFDAILVATGTYWQPRLPVFAGTFSGTLFHAQRYRDPQTPVDTAGKHVIVAGIGNTGCEIAVEMARAGAASVTLSARSGTWIMPKLVNGKSLSDKTPMVHPEDPVLPVFKLLPEKLHQPLFAWIAKKAIRKQFGGQMKRMVELGLPPPPDHPFDKRPTVAQDLLAALEAGDVQARGEILALEGREAVFADGRRAPADVIVCATGFHLAFPFLDASLADTAGDDLRLFRAVMSPRRHDLFFAGLGRPTGAFWPVSEVQARFAAAVLSGAYALPPQAEIDRHASGVNSGKAFNPALYARAMRNEMRRGAARRQR